MPAKATTGNVKSMILSTRGATSYSLPKSAAIRGTAKIHPTATAGANTQSAYIIVDEIDAHYAHAKKSGAEIVMEIRDEDYGGRGYSCLDLEGNLWHFGSYDPWKSES